VLLDPKRKHLNKKKRKENREENRHGFHRSLLLPLSTLPPKRLQNFQQKGNVSPDQGKIFGIKSDHFGSDASGTYGNQDIVNEATSHPILLIRSLTSDEPKKTPGLLPDCMSWSNDTPVALKRPKKAFHRGPL